MQPVSSNVFSQFRTTLEQNNLDAESIDFIIGKLEHTVMDRLMAEIVKQLGPEVKEKLSSPDIEATLAQLDPEFTAKAGKSIEALRAEIAQKMVAEFEAA